MLATVGWLLMIVAGAGAIVWGAELFAEHLAAASSRLGVTSFALALLLAGAEPEELATVVTASSRGVDGVAFGDVIGANAAVITLALGIGAIVTTVPFDARIRRYAWGGIVATILAGWFIWDGSVDRVEGAILAAGYVLFVAVIWIAEREPPTLGEVGELTEGHGQSGRLGREIVLVIVGLGSLTAGSMVLVEAVRRMSNIESTQTRLGLTVVGLATAFELVVLAWSAGRRGLTEAVVAGVVGSFTYNLTMSLGAGALIAPIAIVEPAHLRAPFVTMGLLLLAVVGLSLRDDAVVPRHGVMLAASYLVFVAVVLMS